MSTAQTLFRNKHLIRKLCNWFKWKAKLLRMRRNPFICDRPMKYSLRRLLRLQRFARDLLFRKKKLPFLRNELVLMKRRAWKPELSYALMQSRYQPKLALES